MTHDRLTLFAHDRHHFFKVIHTDRPEARTAEIDLLKQVRHENIVAFFGTLVCNASLERVNRNCTVEQPLNSLLLHVEGEHESEEFIVLVLEYVSGGELFDHIVDNGPMPEVHFDNAFTTSVSEVCFESICSGCM